MTYGEACFRAPLVVDANTIWRCNCELISCMQATDMTTDISQFVAAGIER